MTALAPSTHASNEQSQMMNLSCANCGRSITNPVFIQDEAYGATCAKRIAAKAQVKPTPSQRDLFATKLDRIVFVLRGWWERLVGRDDERE